MNQTAIIQIDRGGTWVDAAEIKDLGNGRCTFDYDTYYAHEKGSLPISLGLPVGLYGVRYMPRDGAALESLDLRLPAFLYDLVPQGRGRQYLSGLLGLPDRDGVELPLLMAGAFNPIGALRIDSAVRFYEQQSEKLSGGRYDFSKGVELDDIRNKSEDFLRELALHAMLAGGTTGVQGAAPKYLLTQDAEGLWYPDMGLPDAKAATHWLLKLPRGRSLDDRLVLRNEAAYLRVAKACGLRVHAEPLLIDDMLFVRRFDRAVTAGRVARLHQESLASLADHRGFSVKTSHNELLAAVRAHVSDPLKETIEYLKREALNQALRNTDNHARNTAVQRLIDGTVALTPVFDLAPMYKDPEMVPRAVHWRDGEDKVMVQWTTILPFLAVEMGMGQDHFRRCASELVDFAEEIAALPMTCLACGVDEAVVNDCRAAIDRVADGLVSLRSFAGGH